jgi:hypothetical protein
METLHTIEEDIRQTADLLNWNMLATILVIAAVTMGVLQLLKDFLPLRWGVQQYWIKKWIVIRAKKYSREKQQLSEKGQRRREVVSRNFLPRVKATVCNMVGWVVYIVSLKFIWESDDLSDQAWKTLIELAAGGRRRALFQLPSDQLVAQMNAAAQIVIAYPKTYRDLLWVLSQGAPIKDVNTLMRHSSDGRSRSKEDETQRSEPYLDARNRITHIVQRNLDAIHIALANDWKLCMQSAAILISLFLAFYAGNPESRMLDVFSGLAAGYLAPVMQDILTRLQSVRQQ